MQKRVGNTVIVIVIDLSMPSNVLPALSKWINATKSVINKLEGKTEEKLKRNEVNNSLSQSNDKKYIDPFPVPLMIVANKYDLFKKEERNKRMHLVQGLRFLAHGYHANLVLSSNKDKNAKDKVQ